MPLSVLPYDLGFPACFTLLLGSALHPSLDAMKAAVAYYPFFYFPLLTPACPRQQQQQAAPAPDPLTGPRVDLNYTTYVGSQLPNGVNQFLGMRYAAAPLGDLRWRAPVEPPSTGQVQPALQVGYFLGTVPHVQSSAKGSLVPVDMPGSRHAVSAGGPRRGLPLRQRLGPRQRHGSFEIARLGVHPGRRYDFETPFSPDGSPGLR